MLVFIARFLRKMAAGGDIRVIIPDDVEEFEVTDGIYVGAEGDLKVTTEEGQDVVLTGLAAGIMHPIHCVKVWSTGTTATGIRGVY